MIVETQPANYNSVSDYDHTTTAPDTDGNDFADGPDNQIPVTLLPNESDMTNDYIEDPLVGSINGTVFNPLGVGVAGVTITLYRDTNLDGNEDGLPLGTIVTNSSGQYQFTGVEPGFYVVVETQPANYTSISDYDQSTTAPDTDGNDSAQGADNDIPVRILPGEADLDNDFIDGNPGAVCGTVLEDTSLPLGGITITLYTDTNNNDSFDIADIVYATTTTAVNGTYCFTNVLPGEYVIRQTQPANYNSVSDYDHTTTAPDTDGVPNANDPDNEISVTLIPGESDLDNDFIEDPLVGIISGFVRNDIGAAMPFVTIRLYGDANNDGNEDGPVLLTTTTNSSGSYSFPNVEPGRYVVVEISPLYYSDISDIDASVNATDTDGNDTGDGPDNDIPVILAPGEGDMDNNFIEGRPGFICGLVRDTFNTPISNVEIKLYLDVNNNDQYDMGIDILVGTAYSDGDSGLYCFEDITPGEYVIVETQPNNYNSVSDYDHSLTGDPDGDDSAQGPDDQIPVTLLPAELDQDNNFYDVPLPGYISGMVTNEVNAPLNNVKIYLYRDTNGDGNEDGMPLDSAYTFPSGIYNFSGIIPGKYVLVEVNPPAFNNISDFDASTSGADTDGNDSAQGPDNDIPVTITPNETDADNNFKDGRPGRICGNIHDDLGVTMASMQVQLYNDMNGNGEMDPEDAMVTLQWTDALGNYCFNNVLSGSYIVNEVQPADYGNMFDVDETPDPDGDDSAQGADDNIPVMVQPNEEDNDNNFVDIRCPGLPTIVGFTIDTICSGESISFQAVNQGIGLVTYNWTFGSGSTPSNATGIGPHVVNYISNATNSTIGAFVVLTITKEGCAPVTDSVATVIVNPIPNPAINAAVTNLCYFAPRTFAPVAANVPGYSYTWSFGSGANITTANTYGPHTIEYSTTGTKTVQLIVASNAPGSSCSDTSTISFTVIQCLGNITGKVINNVTGLGIASVNVKLYPDANLNGLPDSLNGVLVTPVRNVFTTTAGVYSMVGLTPGQYAIVETQPAGYTSLLELDETNDNDTLVTSNLPNDNIIPATVEPQEIDADNVFKELPTPGIVNGYVFNDLDTDNGPDPGEGIAGVTLTVFRDTDANGVADVGGFVTSTTSLGDGFYAIGNLVPGNYVLIEQQPALYANVSDFDATNDGDVVPNTNTMNDTIPFTLANAETDANNYFKEVQACSEVVTNTNDDGPGSLRYVIGCVNPGTIVTFSPSLQGQTIHLNSGRIIIAKNLFIHSALTSPRIMITSDVPGTFMVTAGNSVEMKNIDITSSGLGGTLGAGLENYGNLTLWDVSVFRNPALPPANYLIYNTTSAQMIIKGICRFETN